MSLDVNAAVQLGTSSVRIPLLGMGSSHQQGGATSEAIQRAVDVGVRHFDTAQRYGSEALIGDIIAKSGVPREEFRLVTKLWPDNYSASLARQSVEESCARLRTEYVDCCLLHWPGHEEGSAGRLKVWRLMEDMYNTGLARSIGVSNFLPHHLDELCACAVIKPHMNQCEFNPFQQNKETVAACERHGVVFEGYCPLAKGHGLTHPTVRQLAASKQKTAAQIMIRWSLQHGVVTIPKSTKAARVQENFDVFDFELADDEMGLLDQLECNLRVTWDPSGVE